MDAAIWQWEWHALIIVAAALLISLGIGSAAAWWLRGVLMQQRTDRLQAQMDILEARLVRVAEQLQGRDENLAAVQEELQELTIQLQKNAPRKRLEETAASLSSKAAAMRNAREMIQQILSRPAP